MTELERKFDAAMMRLHREAKQIGYNGTYFVRMLHELGGADTARQLVHTTAPSEGFVRLWERRRLDLTAEKLMTEAQYRPLFSAQGVLQARKRLAEYGYDSPNAGG